MLFETLTLACADAGPGDRCDRYALQFAGRWTARRIRSQTARITLDARVVPHSPALGPAFAVCALGVCCRRELV